MSDDQAEYTKGGNRKKAAMSKICGWIVDAWRDIDKKIIMNGFRKARIVSYPDDAEEQLGISSLPVELGLDQLRLETETDHSDEDDIPLDSNSDHFLNIEISDGEDELLGDEFDGFED